MKQRVVLTPAKFSRAFECMSLGTCPQTDGESGCPFWIEMDENKFDPVTKKVIGERTVAGCGFHVLLEVTQVASNNAGLAAGTSATTQEQMERQVKGIAQLAEAATQAVRVVEQGTALTGSVREHLRESLEGRFIDGEVET